MAVGDMTADTGGEFPTLVSTGCLKSRKPRASRLGYWGTCKPLSQTDQINGGGRNDMLQMGFGQADVTTAAQPAAPDRLLVSAFDTDTGRILLAKRGGDLTGPCRWQSLM